MQIFAKLFVGPLLLCALAVSNCGPQRVTLPESPVGTLAVIGRDVVNGGRAAVSALDLLVTSKVVSPANAGRVLDALQHVQGGAASLFTVLEQIDALPAGSPDRAKLLTAAQASLAELDKWMTEAVARPETEPARRSLSESLMKARDGTATLRGRLGVPITQGGQVWTRAA